MEDQDSQPAALLTNAQRSFLSDEDELAPSKERAMQSRIRERLASGLSDISLVVEKLDAGEIEKAVSDGAAASDLVALAILVDEFSADYGTGMLEYDPETGRHELQEAGGPEGTIRFGISTGFQKLGRSLGSVGVEIEEGPTLDALLEEDLETLSEEELWQLFAADMITATEYREAMTRREIAEAIRESDAAIPDIAGALTDALAEEGGAPTIEDVAASTHFEPDVVESALETHSDEIVARIDASEGLSRSPSGLAIQPGDPARIHLIEDE